MTDQFSHSHNLLINLIGSIIEPTTPPQKLNHHQTHRRLHLALWEQHKPGDLSFPLFNLDEQLSPLAVNTLLNHNHSHHHYQALGQHPYTHQRANSHSIVIDPKQVPSFYPSVEYNSQHSSVQKSFAGNQEYKSTPKHKKLVSSDKENLPFINGYKGNNYHHNHGGNGFKTSTNNSPSSSSSTSSSSDNSSSYAKIDKEYLVMIAKTPLVEIKLDILRLSKDQYGCRFLQKKIDENSVPVLQTRSENFEIIFEEVYPHFYELIIDPFGNYLVQKLIQFCDKLKLNLILEILHLNLFQISINQHGTRALQKIIDGLNNDYQLSLLIKGLQPYIIELIKDLNGNHVIQKILNKFNPVQCQFIYDLILKDLIIVATHKHGCCVLQKCLNHVTETQLTEFSCKILEFSNFYRLINNQFGNYVLQYLIGINKIEINYKIYECFLQYGLGLLCNLKFSLNVVEKYLKNCYQNELNAAASAASESLGLENKGELSTMFHNLSIDAKRTTVLPNPHYSFADLKYELVFKILSLDLNKLINDPYGNYVVQTLLDVLSTNTPSNNIYLLIPMQDHVNPSTTDNVQIQVIKKWFLNCKIVSSFGKRIQLKINSILNGHMQQQNAYKIPRQQTNMNANGEFVIQDLSRSQFNLMPENVNINTNVNVNAHANANANVNAAAATAAASYTINDANQNVNFHNNCTVPNFYQSYTTTHPMHNQQHQQQHQQVQLHPNQHQNQYHHQQQYNNGSGFLSYSGSNDGIQKQLFGSGNINVYPDNGLPPFQFQNSNYTQG